MKRFDVGKKRRFSSSRGRNRKEKMIERLERWWPKEEERLIDARKVACRKLRGEEEGILKQLWTITEA